MYARIARSTLIRRLIVLGENTLTGPAPITEVLVLPVSLPPHLMHLEQPLPALYTLSGIEPRPTMHLLDLLPRLPITALITYIPLFATVVTCYFSVVLARATLRYVEATDKSLALAREEFEREWSPELHIKFERISSSEAQIIVTNLAKLSVLLQLLQIRALEGGSILHSRRKMLASDLYRGCWEISQAANANSRLCFNSEPPSVPPQP